MYKLFDASYVKLPTNKIRRARKVWFDDGCTNQKRAIEMIQSIVNSRRKTNLPFLIVSAELPKKGIINATKIPATPIVNCHKAVPVCGLSAT